MVHLAQYERDVAINMVRNSDSDSSPARAQRSSFVPTIPILAPILPSRETLVSKKPQFGTTDLTHSVFSFLYCLLGGTHVTFVLQGEFMDLVLRCALCREGFVVDSGLLGGFG